ncbi:MAG: hypothetical protein AAGG48_11150 [Planctomycetota bacterium]
MNDDSIKATEERLHSLTPRPLELDAEAVLAAARRSENDGDSTESVPMVLTLRQGLSLTAACIVGMFVGSILTTLLMRPTTDQVTAAEPNQSPVGDSDSSNRDAEPEVIQNPAESDPALVDFAARGDSTGERALPDVDSVLRRNGFRFSLRQQRLVGATDSMGSMDKIATSDVVTSDRNEIGSPSEPLHRRDRLMRELLRM